MSKDQESIVVDYNLQHPPNRVWQALTDPKLLESWLMPNDIRAEVGHRFHFQTQPVGEWDGVVDCEVLEVVPHQRLVYSWRGGLSKPGAQGREVDTIVAWELRPSGSGGTILHLEHSGFDPASFAFKAMGEGWRGKLAERLERLLAANVAS
jgi:uncharacterized protein YndB with AHSA1/START domain